MSLLLPKILVSAFIVIAVTAAVERFGPRIGGLVASLPQLSVIALVFFGLEQGLPFAAESAFWAIPGLLVTATVYVGFVLGARWAGRRRLLAIVAGVLLGSAMFAAASAVVGALPRSPAVPIAAAVAVYAASLGVLRRYRDTGSLRRVPVSPRLLVARAAVASGSVVLLTGVAHVLGPKWSGVLVGFPVNSLPVVVVLQFHYGLDVIEAMARVIPVGLIGLCLFNVVAWLTVLHVGLVGAIGLGYLVDVAYLAAAEAVHRRAATDAVTGA